MESKKTFGEYICRRRKELGLTQKEFAGRLYVTESAVSKWERGLSYPDITLIHDICAVLDISEHELLTASEDTERRTSEKLAAKYLRLTRRYRMVQYLLYGIGLLSFVIGGLSTGQPPLWYAVVFCSLLLAASLTLVPALAAAHPHLEGCKWAVSLGCAAVSLELLLLSRCLYGGEHWFPPVGISVLFGLTLVLLPFLLPTLPLPDCLARRKTSLYLATETALLLLLLLIQALWSGADWFPMTATGTLFGLSLFCTPVYLRQLPLPSALKSCKFTLYCAVETALLLALLLTAAVIDRVDWFPLAASAILFGFGLFLLPAALRQLPLPAVLSQRKVSLYLGIETILLLLLFLTGYANSGALLRLPQAVCWLLFGAGLFTFPVYLRQLPLPAGLQNHKALLYCAGETLLFLLALLANSFYGAGLPDFIRDLPYVLLFLLLPWGLLTVLRYLPGNHLFRAGAALGWGALWIWLAPWGVEQVNRAHGWISTHPWELTAPFGCDFTRWAERREANIACLVLMGTALLALVLMALGQKGQRDSRR